MQIVLTEKEAHTYYVYTNRCLQYCIYPKKHTFNEIKRTRNENMTTDTKPTY